MDRKETAAETLQIIQQGWYEYAGHKIDISEAQNRSVKKSILIPPGEPLFLRSPAASQPHITVVNQATVKAILNLFRAGVKDIGVLNFASAKNPGGGFLNGAMAQEESLAASSGLYQTQCAYPEYYQSNRACPSMIYTDYAIYSPDVVFFRDEQFRLLAEPVTASVLTLPAVNFGQVIQKKEDTLLARTAMKERMRRSLQIFAHMGNRTLILGAYGCGVFRNAPADVARWWQELLKEDFAGYFDHITYAVLDTGRSQACIQAFCDCVPVHD